MTNILFALLVATNLSTTPAGDAVKKAPEAVEAPAEQAEAKAEAPAAEPETAEGVAEETRKVDFHTSKTICGEFTKDDNANTQQLMQEGEVYLRLGQFLSARQNFCAAYFHGPDDMVVLEKLRRTLISLGDTTELTEITAKLAHLYATSPNPYAMQRANSRLDELITLAPDHAGRHAVDVALGRVKRESDGDDLHLFDRFRSFIGIFVILGLALLMSNNRKRINYRIVSWGLGLQLFFAVIILWTPPGRYIFDAARRVIAKILAFTDDGGEFLFGSIYRGVYPKGAFGPIQVTDGVTGDMVAVGHIFVFHVLPTIVFFGALMAVFYHLGIIQKIVEGIAWVMTRTLGTSGAESLSAAGNIFVGQTEAPLLIKPYISKMTNSELMAVMTGGFATVAGGVLAAYVRFGLDAGHLLAASVMSAPAALVIAKIIYPETETPVTAGGSSMGGGERTTTNVIDAAASGASDGLKLALNVGAMLMAFIALIAMLNWMIGGMGSLVGIDGLSLKQLFGYFFYPLSWVMGVDTKDLLDFGNLLGTKVSLNEFVAFVDLGRLKATMTDRSFTIATYALCGFANFSSIGIQIGGISAIAPERRSDLAKIGLKAMAGGALASWLTATVVGVML